MPTLHSNVSAEIGMTFGSEQPWQASVLFDLAPKVNLRWITTPGACRLTRPPGTL